MFTEKDIKIISELYKGEKEPLYDKLKDVVPVLIELEYKKNLEKKKKAVLTRKNRKQPPK